MMMFSQIASTFLFWRKEKHPESQRHHNIKMALAQNNASNHTARYWFVIGILVTLLAIQPAKADFDFFGALRAFFMSLLAPSDTGRTALEIGTIGEVSDQINKFQKKIFDSELALEFDEISNQCDIDERTTKAIDIELRLDEIRTDINDEALKTALTTESPAKFSKQRITDHNNKYCTAEEVSFQICETAGTVPGGDVSVSNFNKRQYESDDEKEAAKAFSQNLINPNPSNIPLTATTQSSAYRDARQLQLVETARMALASNSIAETIAARTSSPASETSLLQSMHDEADKRYLNPEFYQQIQGEPTATLLRRQLIMNAIMMKTMVRQYEQSMRQESLIATLLAIQTKADSGDKIQEALLKAAAVENK